MANTTSSSPSLSQFKTYDDLFAYWERKTSLVKQSDFVWQSYTEEQQVEQLKPAATLLWKGGGKAPSRCSICHLPAVESRRGGFHECIFAPCTSYKHCLGAFEKYHKAECDQLREKKARAHQLERKRKHDSKHKENDEKVQKKADLALKMNRLVTFSKRVGEDEANNTYIEAVVNVRGESEELAEEHEAAEKHLQLLQQRDANPMYERTRQRVTQLTEQIRRPPTRHLSAAQSYHSPPPTRFGGLPRSDTPSVHSGTRPPIESLSNDQLEARKLENEAENRAIDALLAERVSSLSNNELRAYFVRLNREMCRRFASPSSIFDNDPSPRPRPSDDMDMLTTPAWESSTTTTTTSSTLTPP